MTSPNLLCFSHESFVPQEFSVRGLPLSFHIDLGGGGVVPQGYVGVTFLVKRNGGIPVKRAAIVLRHLRECHLAVVWAVELGCLRETRENVSTVSIENTFAAIRIRILGNVEFWQVVATIPFIPLQTGFVVSIDDIFVDVGKIVVLQLLARAEREIP